MTDAKRTGLASAQTAAVNAPEELSFSRGEDGLRNLCILFVSSLTVMAGATTAPGLTAHFAAVANAEFLTRMLLTTHGLTIAVLAPFAGYQVDRIGRKPMLVGASLLYALAGTAGVWLNTLPDLLFSRARLGAAVAVTMTVGTTLIGDYSHGSARDLFVGVQSAAMALGGIVFMLGGGMLAEWSWRGPFIIYLNCGAGI